ncbi:MAG: hypothetical protein WC375_00010 [Methanomassiliicoccales archaeon]|jgi:hypothetical protein
MKISTSSNLGDWLVKFAQSMPQNETDQLYLELTKDPIKNETKLRQIVNNAAKKAGYVIGPVWHGTPDSRALNSRPIFDRQRNVTTIKDQSVANELQSKLNNEAKNPNHPTEEYFRLLEQVKENQSEDRQNVPIYFADNYNVAKTYADDRRAFDYQNSTPTVFTFYVRIKNPKSAIDTQGLGWTKRGGPTAQEEAIQQAKKEGYDGLIIKNTRDTYNSTNRGPLHSVIVAFSPEQLKSAEIITKNDNGNIIPPSQRFQINNPDTRY